MRKSKPEQAKYNLVARCRATAMSQAFLTANIRQCERAKADTLSGHRAAQRECQHCYYLRSSIIGRAFTNYICVACHKTRQHPNTGIPVLCPKCADRFRACSRCGGSRELDTRLQLPVVLPKTKAQAKKSKAASGKAS